MLRRDPSFKTTFGKVPPRTFAWEEPRSVIPPGQLPLVSVVMPVYNQKRYVREGIESVLQENELPLELILVNDGSTDGSEAIINEFAADARVRIVNQENRGLPRALNRGFQEARGGFLTWTSADNRFRSGALRTLAEYLVANPSVGLVYGNVILIDESGREYRNSAYRPLDQDTANSAILRLPRWSATLTEFHDNFVNAWFLIRRLPYELVRWHNPAFRLYEDFDFWLRLAAISQVAHVDSQAPLYEYRLHRESLTSRLDPDQLERDVRSRQEEIRSMIRDASARSGSDRITLGTSSSANGQAVHVQVSKGESSADRKTVARFLVPEFGDTVDLHLKRGEGVVSVAHCCSPLNLPAILRRARDTDFGAISPADGTTRTLLAFMPEFDARGFQSAEFVAELARYVASNRHETVALFCESVGQRRCADAVNLKLSSNVNLRILDFTHEYGAAASSDVWHRYNETLLYALSSADAILALGAGRQTAAYQSALRIELGLAAMAQIPVLVMGTVFRDLIGNEIRQSPHAIFLTEGIGKQAALRPVGVGSIEQWIDEQSTARFARRIDEALLSLALAPEEW